MKNYFQARNDLNTLRFKLGAKSVITYPCLEIPKGRSEMHSPQVGVKHGLDDFDFTKYEEMMWEVRSVRDQVEKGEYPYQFLRKYFPKRWGELPLELPPLLQAKGLSHLDPQSLANIVHMDKPVDLGFAIMDFLLANKVKNRLKHTNSGHFEFLDLIPRFIGDLSRKIETSLNHAFQAKYYFGVARPEEVYEHLTGIPGKGITHYRDNSYNHPSYPAGHGSAAGATGRFFQDACNLEHHERNDIRRACYLWAMFRTFAGVHYAVDNLAGLIGIGKIE